MWTLIWDTIGYFVDNVPRWAKITLLALLALAVFFFFGYRASIYVIGGIFWFMFLFLVVAHIIVFRKNLKKQKEAAPPPLTPGDQEDISEFQEAMLQEVGPESPMQTLTDTKTGNLATEPKVSNHSLKPGQTTKSSRSNQVSGPNSISGGDPSRAPNPDSEGGPLPAPNPDLGSDQAR